MQSYSSAKVLLGPEAWDEDHAKTFALNIRIAEYVHLPRRLGVLLTQATDY